MCSEGEKEEEEDEIQITRHCESDQDSFGYVVSGLLGRIWVNSAGQFSFILLQALIFTNQM
jgi:hypothetical protein